MSSEIFTHPPGVKFPNGKMPEFNTLVQRAVSGRELRIGLRQYPLWIFTFQYEFLRNTASFTEYQNLLGFFLRMRGKLDSFLYLDKVDNSVTNHNFGVGTGSLSTFQLTRTFGGFTEPVHNIKTLTNIKNNGTVVSGANYTVSSTGLVTFNSPPANTNVLSWTGEYYYRCRFMEDEADFEEFFNTFWELGELQFVGSLLNKV